MKLYFTLYSAILIPFPAVHLRPASNVRFSDFPRAVFQRHQGHHRRHVVSAHHQSSPRSERPQLQAVRHQELPGEGGYRKAAHQSSDHLPAAGRVQSVTRRQPAGVHQGFLSQDQRPDAGGLPGLAHPLRGGPPQPHQQQDRKPRRREERGSGEGRQQEREERRQGEGQGEGQG